MNPKIMSVLIAMLLAAFGLLGAGSQPNPAEAARLNNLGCAYMNQQLFEKGLAAFQQAAEADPKLLIARLNQAVAYMNLQKTDEAKALLEDVIKQDPKNPNAWYSLGLLAKNTGDARAAVEAFKHVTEIDPNDADTWYFLGTAYTQAKQFPQAEEALQRALQINPLHASAEFGLSRAYQQAADADRARDHLKRFQYITQNKIGAPMSLAYGEQGQYSRAVDSPAYVLKPPPQIKVRFVDVTKEAGLPTAISNTAPTASACFIDYDNDGMIDLFLADGGPHHVPALFHNLGQGKFEDATEKLAPVAEQVIGCTAGDYDNDGFSDLALTATSGLLLLHNEKGSKFVNVAQSTGLPSIVVNAGSTSFTLHSVIFVDYDHDGDLDLLVTATETPATTVMRQGDAVVAAANPRMWRNNGNGTFSDVTSDLGFNATRAFNAIGTDYNNDRAVDLAVSGATAILENPREGKFIVKQPWSSPVPATTTGISVLDFDHDGWMDIAFTHTGPPGLTLWRNNHGKSFDRVPLPETNWARAFGVAAFDYDNDGWVDLVAVGETKEGKGEIKLFRNLGPDGFKDVTADVGLDKIHLEHPRAIITGDYDNDGATDLLVTQNHGPAVLLRNEGGNQNHWLRLALSGLNDNRSAIGTKVEVFSGGNRQKFEIYGSNGYLGQNSPYLTVGLGDAKVADVVRLTWPTGVLQDEIEVAGDKQQNFPELDRRGSSCPTLFAWNGQRYEFVADMLGAGVVGHWVGPGQRDIPRPVEYIKIDRNKIREKPSAISRQPSAMTRTASVQNLSPAPDDRRPATVLSFRFMEPLEEVVYLDQVRLIAVDHPADVDVYPNEYFASNPPYPEFKVVVSRDPRPPAGAWDEHGHNVLPDLLARRYFGDFKLTQFLGFAQPHSLTLDLGEPYAGGPLWLLLHGEVEYFSANSMYAASQAGIKAISPYVEALVGDGGGNGQWKRVVADMGFPAGGPRTMTADLTGKLPKGTRKIRIATNLQIYWDSILIDRTPQDSAREIPRPAGENAGLRDDAAGSRGSGQFSGMRHSERSRSSGGARNLASSAAAQFRLTEIPLVRADLQFHGYPLKIEGTPPGNVNYIYEQASATGPYTRPAGTYTRYGDVLPLLTATDDKLVVFGSGDEVRLDFDPAKLPALPQGWVRDYFFAANGYEKDMDFYAAEGNYVAPLPFMSMGEYPYGPRKSFPLDDAHLNYLLEYNTRHMSGNEQRGYRFAYGAN
jgi:tetratricopeptide (TPR) repeat protein